MLNHIAQVSSIVAELWTAPIVAPLLRNLRSELCQFRRAQHDWPGRAGKLVSSQRAHTQARDLADCCLFKILRHRPRSRIVCTTELLQVTQDLTLASKRAHRVGQLESSQDGCTVAAVHLWRRSRCKWSGWPRPRRTATVFASENLWKRDELGQ